MEILTIKNLFDEKELSKIQNKINNSDFVLDNNLGRNKCSIDLSPSIKQKLELVLKNLYNIKLSIGSADYVEYNNLYGTPTLPPHFDGDSCDLLLNYQLSSNTVWGVGLDKKIYNLQDNEAVIFSPNEIIHWRPIKNFLSGEYVKMIFFRFYNLKSPSDHSDKRYSLDHEVFKEINEYRNSLEHLK